MDFFQAIGALGLMLITLGVLTRGRRSQDELYVLGGIFLLTYSYHIGDPIFIILQVVFTVAAVYDFIKSRRKVG